MSIEENKSIARRYFLEVWNEMNLDLIDELLDPGYVRLGGRQIYGAPITPDVQKGVITRFKEAFPDATFTIVEQIAEGDRVVNRMRATGSHTGTREFMGVPPTGNNFECDIIAILIIKDGKIAGSLVSDDDLGLLQQLGATIQLPQER